MAATGTLRWCKLMSNQIIETGTTALETVNELDFTFDHPEVGKHTDRFFGLQKWASLFDAFDGIQKPSRDLAVVLGTFWCVFSALMPRFASRAAGMIRDNLKRHFVIQTRFEELGGGDGDQIHAGVAPRIPCVSQTAPGFKSVPRKSEC
jgi:hypothetical protein